MFGNGVENFLTLTGGRRYQPVLDFIVLEPIEDDKITPGGVVLPDTMERDSAKVGRIVRMGPGLPNADGTAVPFKAELGEIVILNPTRTVYGLKEDGVSYYVAGDRDICGKIEEPTAAPTREPETAAA